MIITKLSLLSILAISLGCISFLTTPINADGRNPAPIKQGLRTILTHTNSDAPNDVHRQLQDAPTSRQEKFDACLQQNGCINISPSETFTLCHSKEHIENVESSAACMRRHFECRSECSYQVPTESEQPGHTYLNKLEVESGKYKVRSDKVQGRVGNEISAAKRCMIHQNNLEQRV